MSLMAIVLGGYGFMALFFVRPLAGHVAYACSNQDKPDWGWGYLSGVVLSVFWPVVLVSFIVGLVVPPVGAERQVRLRQQQARIRKLEHELEVRA